MATKSELDLLSERLAGFLMRPSVFALLRPYACGWKDGGCVILAEAIVSWLGLPSSSVHALRDGRYDHFQHALVIVGTRLALDADGVSDPSWLCEHWQRTEFVHEPWIDRFDHAALRSDIPHDHALSAELARRLEQALPARLSRPTLGLPAT